MIMREFNKMWFLVNKIIKENSLLKYILLVLLLILLNPIFTITNILCHEGGHGIFVLPAIILNREIPEPPKVQGYEGGIYDENPFKNFPLAAVLCVLSFPLGTLADLLLFIFSYKLAKDYYKKAGRFKYLFISSMFLSLSLIFFSSMVTNLFLGADFSFIWEGIGFPMKLPLLEVFFNYIVPYILLPLYLIIKKRFEVLQIISVVLAIYIGSEISFKLVVNPFYEMFMRNIWYLFIIGTSLLILVLLFFNMLLKNLERGGLI